MPTQNLFARRSFLFGAVSVLVTLHGGQLLAQSLGSAETFAALGASTLTNTGSSVVTGDVGVAPGTAVTGFPPGRVMNGAVHAGDATATQAHADLASAYTAFAGLVSPPANNLSGTDLGGKTLTPGVYRYNTSATLGGVLTFDALGDSAARFVVQVGTTLITSSGSSVVLKNGADARNVYFQVGSSATLGSGSSFIGNILAYAAITTVNGTSVTGRLLAVTEAVTLDSNAVTSPGLSPSTPSSAQLLNISTRLKVESGDNASIVGFIVTGNAPKKVMVRGIGPSLLGMGPVLADPTIELHGPDGSTIASNNNWKDSQQTEIENSRLAPSNDLESAIVATLAPGNYTAILRGQNGSTGVGLVEMYDLAVTSDSRLANVSSRGMVQTDNDVMIGGFILGNGAANEKVVIRAMGPSLTRSNIAAVLADPTLELHDGNGTLLIANDNWKDDPNQAALIAATGLQPTDDQESAALVTLSPGAYTAIVAGKNRTNGVGVVEVYHLN